MYILLLDGFGNPALIPETSLNKKILHQSSGAKNIETGKILKAPSCGWFPPISPFAFPPVAVPLFAHTKYGKQICKNPLLWQVGLQANNGFCLPEQSILEKNHTLVNRLCIDKTIAKDIEQHLTDFDLPAPMK